MTQVATPTATVVQVSPNAAVKVVTASVAQVVVPTNLVQSVSANGIARVANVTPAASSYLEAQIVALENDFASLSSTVANGVGAGVSGAISTSAANTLGEANANTSNAVATAVANLTQQTAAQIEAESAVAVNLANQYSTAAIAAANEAFQTELTAKQTLIDASDTAISAANDAISAAQGNIATIQGDVATLQGDSASAIAQLSSIATTILSIQSDVGANTSAITVQAGALATAKDSIAGQITQVQSDFDGQISSVQQSLATVSTAQTATATAVTALTTTVNNNTAAITQNATTASDASSANAALISKLTSTVQGNTAQISQNALTASNATSTLAGTVDALQTSFNNNAASVQNSLSTQSTAISANAASLSTLTADVQGNTATINQNAVTAASATQTVATNLATLQTNFNNNEASVSNQIATLTNQQGSTATQVSTLSASVGSAIGGGNDVPDSNLTSIIGWSSGYTIGLDLPGFFSANSNVLYLSAPTNSNGADGDINSPMMTAQPGVRYEFSAYAAFYNASSCTVLMGFLNSSGAAISYTSAGAGGTAGGGQAGDPAYFQQIGGFATAPAGTVSRYLILRTNLNGTANAYGLFMRPFSRTASASQTTLSPYSSGTQANVGAINSTISTNATVAANATQTVAGNLSDFESIYNGNKASVNTQLSTLSSSTTANAAAISTLQTNVSGNTATINSNNVTQSNATSTVASNLSTLQTTYENQVASYNNQIAILTNAQSSTATQVSSLNANFSAGGGSGNLIANSDFNPSFDGWTFGASVAGGLGGLNLAEWSSPSGVPGVLWSTISGTPPVGNVLQWVYHNIIAVQPGQTYELSVFAAYHRCQIAQVFVYPYDSNSNALDPVFLGQGGVSLDVTGQAAANGLIQNFQQIGGFYTVPSGTAYISILTQAQTDGTEANPYYFLTRPMIRVANPGQTQLSAYTSGAQVNVANINANIQNQATVAATATASVAAQLNSLTSTYQGQVASYNSQIATLSDTATTQATSIQSLQTSVGGNSSSISTLQASVGGISAQYVVAGTINGQTGGFVLSGVKTATGGAVFGLEIDANVTINGSLLVNGTMSQNALTTQAYGTLVTARNASISNILGASQLAFMAIVNGALAGNLEWNGASTPFEWIAADNSYVEMDAQTVVALGKAAASFRSNLFMCARVLKNNLASGQAVNVTADASWTPPSS